MKSSLSLDRMTTIEKLRLMEELWADLSRNENQIESPGWHEQVLRERDERLSSGRELSVDWDVAKKQLFKRPCPTPT
ncbi:MAG TPA: addiction module protein [Verrucomicrobiae bacterium]|jgi:hypothetical protein|nr:addiction module protein [Verrucomicrobiae bacterium]